MAQVLDEATTGDPFEITVIGLQEIKTKSFHTLNKSLLEIRIGYNDVGDGCWKRNVLVTILRCW